MSPSPHIFCCSLVKLEGVTEFIWRAVRESTMGMAGFRHTNIHITQSVQWWSIVMQQVDIHTHLKEDCRGFEALIYPPLSPQQKHTNSHVIHRSSQEPLCSKPTPVHHTKTHEGRKKDTKTLRHMLWHSGGNPLFLNNSCPVPSLWKRMVMCISEHTNNIQPGNTPLYQPLT